MKTGCPHMSWAEVLQLMVSYTEQDLASEKADYPSRIKQWFSYLKQGISRGGPAVSGDQGTQETDPIRDACCKRPKATTNHV
ncbi:hypothetical protein RI537_04620 [Aeromonas salmonicida]